MDIDLRKIVENIKNMNLSEIKDIMFNSEDWYTLCLLSKELNNEPIRNVLQKLSDQYANNSKRKAYDVMIDETGNISIGAADGNTGKIEVFNDKKQYQPFSKRIVMSDIILAHENKHMDDWTMLKYCKPPKYLKRHHNKLLSKNKKKLLKISKPDKDSPLTNVDEKDMQVLIVSKVIDDNMWDYVKKNQTAENNLVDNARVIYTYLNPYELRARLAEHTAILNIIDSVKNINDTSTKKKLLDILTKNVYNEHHEWLNKIYEKNNNGITYIDDYFGMCEEIFKRNFKGNNQEILNEYKASVNEYLKEFSKNTEIIKSVIEHKMKEIKKQQNREIALCDKDTTNAMTTIFDIDMQKINNSYPKILKESISKINNNFNISLIKNTIPPKQIKVNNILHFTNQLVKINDFADKYLTQEQANEFKLLTKSIASKILNTEKDILLIANGAYEKLQKIESFYIGKEQEKPIQDNKLLEWYKKVKEENITKENERKSTFRVIDKNTKEEDFEL